MSGILRLESLTKGNTLKQGDKTPLKYRLFDADGEKLSVAGKSAKVRLVYPDFLTIGYERDGLTVAQDDTVTFTIDRAIPARIYHVEIIVDDKFVFPSRADEAKFTVDKSSLGADANIIEIVGKDVLIREVKSQVDTELQPLVTSLESAQQAETQRATEESSRVSAEEQRKADHANRSAELAAKADKVVFRNLIPVGYPVSHNGTTSNVLNSDTNETEITLSSLGVDRGLYHNIDNNINDILYVYAEYLTKGLGIVRFTIGGNLFRIDNQGIGEYYKYSAVSVASSRTMVFYHDTSDGNSYEVGDSFKINKRMVINLTQTFGAGNEPSKEQMDKLIKVIGYIDGEYALNNKEMLSSLMNGIHEKANKKQETWITPTLLNGWDGVSVQYMKDSFGFVHLRGYVRNGTINTISFFLPSSHASSVAEYFTTESQGMSTGVVHISPQSNGTAEVLIRGGDVRRVSLSGITFQAKEG